MAKKFLILLAVFISFAAQAQAPLTITTARSPTSTIYRNVRALAPIISKELNVDVIAAREPGAGGLIAYNHALGDKNTVIIDSADGSIYPNKKTVLDGFEAVAFLYQYPNILITRGNNPYNSLSEMIAANKPQITIGASVGATNIMVAVRYIESVYPKAHITYVPYSQGTFRQDVLSGILDMSDDIYWDGTISLFKNHQAKIIAGPKSPYYSQGDTWDSLRLPLMSKILSTTTFVFVPKSWSDARKQQIHDAFVKAMDSDPAKDQYMVGDYHMTRQQSAAYAKDIIDLFQHYLGNTP